MAGVAPHERLRCARAARAEDLDALSRRTGVRVRHLAAIEDARFADLPPGIYARAAIKSFAAAYGLEPADILAECGDLLPAFEDQIEAIARVHHVRPATARVRAAPADPATPSWRPLAAAALDAAIIGMLLVIVCACAATLARVPIAALGASAFSLALVGLVIAAAYFVWFGGLAGATAGGLAAGASGPASGEVKPLTLEAIAVRAFAAAMRDAQALRSVGEWLGRRLVRPGNPRNAPRSEHAPWPLRRRDPLLGPWSSASRPAGAPPPPLHPRRG